MSGTRPDDLRPGSEIFANGNREGSNNFLWDGIDNNERLTLSIVLRPRHRDTPLELSYLDTSAEALSTRAV